MEALVRPDERILGQIAGIFVIADEPVTELVNISPMTLDDHVERLAAPVQKRHHQQAILNAIKSQLLSPGTFFRLPWVSWTAPKAVKTDMGGFSLLSLFAGSVTSGSPPPAVLKPTGGQRLPDGESALTITDAAKRAAVDKFMNG